MGPELLIAIMLQLYAQTQSQPPALLPVILDSPPVPSDDHLHDQPPVATPVFPRSIRPASAPTIVRSSERGVDWRGVFRGSARFLAIEQGFRLLTEPGTRAGLKGNFFGNYARAVGSLHGWADGDEFYVNYVGHPMQGSVAGFIWVQNDRSYRTVEFGKDRAYWRSRLRAAAFAWAYSEQFEIGPVSEASIGGIQKEWPAYGFVDHIITPSIGLGWMIGEDFLDRYLIRRIEMATRNRFVRLVSRSALNPSRSFANVLQGAPPWRRDTREGILSFNASDTNARSAGVRSPVQKSRDLTGAAPFEFQPGFQSLRFFGPDDVICLGGDARAAFRLSAGWQWVASVAGCKLRGLGQDLSGDSLTYVTGPRLRTRDWGPWSASLELLVGGAMVTEERMFPQVKVLLEQAAARGLRPMPSHRDYTAETGANGLAITGGGGLSFKMNSALAFRSELSYQQSWLRPLWGRSFSGAMRFSTGLILRMGTW